MQILPLSGTTLDVSPPLSAGEECRFAFAKRASRESIRHVIRLLRANASCRKRPSAKMTMLQPLRCAFFPIRGYALVQVLLQSRHRSFFSGSWRHCCAWGVAGDDGVGATPAYDLLIASGQLDWSSGLPTAAREVDTTASASSSIDAPAPQRLLQVQTLCLENHVLLKLSL